jgi:hypothetical protein
MVRLEAGLDLVTAAIGTGTSTQLGSAAFSTATSAVPGGTCSFLLGPTPDLRPGLNCSAAPRLILGRFWTAVSSNIVLMYALQFRGTFLSVREHCRTLPSRAHLRLLQDGNLPGMIKLMLRDSVKHVIEIVPLSGNDLMEALVRKTCYCSHQRIVGLFC